jgi:large subunit ribosomal protein L2
MGKNLRQQRRGKATQRYLVPSFRYLGKVTYNNMPAASGVVVDIAHAPGRRGPVALVDFGGSKSFVIAGEGMAVGQNFQAMKLKDIPEGSKIYNIELSPGDGGRLCRSTGAFATIISKEAGRCTILLPSQEKKVVSAECLATPGSAAASGRVEKPFMKAGARFYQMRALGKLYPRTSGVSMNAVNHPFGGQTRPGKPKTVSRHMPPGKKVGSISPRRTGRRKR